MNSKKHQIELTRQDDVNDINPQCFSRGNDYRESLGPNVTNVMAAEKDPMTTQLQREIKRWQQAVTDSRTTIVWLEERGDEKTKRIRELEAQVKDLGGTP